MDNYYKKYCQVHDWALAKLEITSTSGEELTHDQGFQELCDLSSKLAEKRMPKIFHGKRC